MEMLDVVGGVIVGGIAWDPEIRGFLSVLVGVIVLCGSVWLLLSTNSGARLGTLLALCGFFGWMLIMGIIWWMYGIGYAGDSPTWQLQEINRADLSQAALDDARSLPNPDENPPAYDLVVASDNEVAIAEFGPVTPETLTPDQTVGLSDEQIDALVDDLNRRNRTTTLSELAAVAPELVVENEDGGSLDFGGWSLLSTAESGEAVASATAFLEENGIFATSAEFKVLDSYDIGGKPGRESDGVLDRVTNKITNTLQITHPTHYAVVQVQGVIGQEPKPGQAPPRPVVVVDDPVVSVIMIRDLGNLRQLPALVTGFSFFIFIGLAYLLHERDKLLMERRTAFEAGKS